MLTAFLLLIAIIPYYGSVAGAAGGSGWPVYNGDSGTDKSLMSVAYGEGEFVAVGEAGTILSSSDGLSWTPHQQDANIHFTSVTYGHDQFVAVGNSKNVYTSEDGKSWTAHAVADASPFFTVVYGDGVYVATGFANAWTSPDGKNWTKRDFTGYLQSGSAYGNNSFVTVGQAGHMMRSGDDGETWSPINVDENHYLDSVAYGNGVFVAVGNNAGYTSADGISWTMREVRGASVIFADGIFAAMGWTGELFTSADGIVWTERSRPTPLALNDIAYGNDSYIAVGRYGEIVQYDFEHTVSFDSQGGSPVASISDVSWGATIAEPAVPVKSGFTFLGWYTEENPTMPWNFGTDKVTSDLTLYAKWAEASGEPELYLVYFLTEEGSSIVEVKSGSTITEPVAPKRSGYTFAGWYKDPELTIPWNFSTDKVTFHVMLIAKWEATPPVEPETYAVIFNSQGGSAVADVKGLVAGATISAPPVPTRSGYTFEGWYKDAGYATAWNFSTDTVTANTTLYAKWAAIPSGGGDPGPIIPGPVQPQGPIVSNNGNLSLPAGREGEVSLGDEIFIEIPANAITKSLILTIEKRLTADGLLTGKETLVSSVFEVLKNFPENFSAPIKLALRFDPSKLGEGQKPVIFYYDETKQEWVEIGGVVSGDRITAKVDHFTKFAVFGVGEPAQTGADFDDISGHWAEETIRQAASAGIATGYEDGSFKPNRTVTRAEFAVMLMNALKSSGEESELAFEDAANIPAWARIAVALAVQAGIITGYEDGTFRPDDVITRAEMAAMIANALKPTPQASAATGFADDADIPVWAKDAAAALQKLGVMEGTGDNLFRPDAQATRAQAVTILTRMQEQLIR